MEPSTPPPKKRRRRWLIAAFVLVLVSTVVWRNWPRGDARSTTLTRNGTVFSAGLPNVQDSEWGKTSISRWRVEKDRFIEEPIIGNRRVTQFANRPMGWSGYRLNDRHSTFRLSFEYGDGPINQFNLSADDWEMNVTYTRIPE